MEGYESLSLLFSKYPELAILRRFGRLSLKCLLYKQAELAWLEARLQYSAEQISRRQSGCRMPESWDDFASDARDEEIAYQRTMMDTVQEKLQNFHAMLLQTSSVLRMLPADPADLGAVRTFLSRQPEERSMHGIEALSWKSDNAPDLVALSPVAQSDPFAQKLSALFLPCFHRLIGKHSRPEDDVELGRLWYYDKRSFTTAGNVICVLLSFGVPTASILALYFIEPMWARLLLVCTFNLLFAVGMVFLVGSRRGEVFAATAAFAAVQVVFVGGVNIIQRA